jgi:hypothetical protein
MKPDRVCFGEVLETIDKLSLDEQESLLDILHHRLREQRRAKVANNIQEARKEFQQGLCQPATPSEIMKDIFSRSHAGAWERGKFK